MNDFGSYTSLVEEAVKPPVTVCVTGLMYISGADSPFSRSAMESVFAQTVPLDELVLVISGTLTDEQEGIIAGYQTDPRIPSLEIVRATSYVDGMNQGLALCRGQWIMRLDGDTISHRDRLAILLDYTERHPEVAVFSSWCEEFGPDGRRIKVTSIHHEAVVNALRWRNALVAPSTLLRRDVVEAVGGFRANFATLPEYDLHVRLVLSGATFRVIPAELVAVPARSRSGGWSQVWEEIRFRTFCWRSGFLNTKQFLIITLCQNLFELAGATIRRRLYRLVRSYPESYTMTCVIVRPTRNA